VNLKGEFNVPYGWKKHLDVTQKVQILAVSRALQGRTLRCADFADAVEGAGSGDFVYLDPPYTVTHENNGFLKYNAKVFSWADQRRLATTARDLAARGCHVLMTNACHPSIRRLYYGLSKVVIQRASRIAASADFRGRVNELVITNLR
jgi:DNA adenine methylase